MLATSSSSSSVLLATAAVVVLAAAGAVVNAQYTATYTPGALPPKTEEGQSGTNACGTGSNQTALCQNSYLNGLDDFCLFGPPSTSPTPDPDSLIGNIEATAVSYCLKSGYGTRLFPPGTITGAHWVKTPKFVQITGVGDLTKLGIPDGDSGGELDPHGADGFGNPRGSLVFSSAFSEDGKTMQQIHEWTQFISYEMFCVRACVGDDAATYCEHIYDVLGCRWNMPANYSAGSFDSCAGEPGEPMGIYGSSTFYQGQEPTPSAHPAPATSACTSLTALSYVAAPTSGLDAATNSTSSQTGPTSMRTGASSTASRSSSSSAVSQTASAGAAGASSAAAGSAGPMIVLSFGVAIMGAMAVLL